MPQCRCPIDPMSCGWHEPPPIPAPHGVFHVPVPPGKSGCSGCPFHGETEEGYTCNVMQGRYSEWYEDGAGRPAWCPLTNATIMVGLGLKEAG